MGWPDMSLAFRKSVKISGLSAVIRQLSKIRRVPRGAGERTISGHDREYLGFLQRRPTYTYSRSVSRLFARLASAV